MTRFFQESDGDYLALDTATNAPHLRTFGQAHFEGRAAARVGLVGSVCMTAVSRECLHQHCKRVPRARVPAEWRKALGL